MNSSTACKLLLNLNHRQQHVEVIHASSYHAIVEEKNKHFIGYLEINGIAGGSVISAPQAAQLHRVAADVGCRLNTIVMSCCVGLYMTLYFSKYRIDIRYLESRKISERDDISFIDDISLSSIIDDISIIDNISPDI